MKLFSGELHCSDDQNFLFFENEICPIWIAHWRRGSADASSNKIPGSNSLAYEVENPGITYIKRPDESGRGRFDRSLNQFEMTTR